MMTTRKHPHEPQEGGSDEPVTASLEDRTAELDSALAEAKDRYLRLAQGIDPSWLKGLELSVRKLEDALGTHGLQPIESVGARFDPKLHEAVGEEESAEHPEDTVVSELRRGYRLRDRVVRPALVKVARTPQNQSD
ncbi:MAG: nucleotide exchange factor GrpE [Actinobacteria bacterium 13_2_20CM_2_66_6]|nr:MAG: nucleotide exchange factor GrpE [Actinobacteria bacterium 13_2_20CM_2_66_6]